MNISYKNVAILPNTSKNIDPNLLSNLVKQILDAGCTLRSSPNCQSMLAGAGSSITFSADRELFSGCDIIFVLGGDGSIIEAARRSVGYDIPIAGINCGRLGYLAEIEMDETDLVDKILAGHGTIEERIMLDVSLIRGGEVQHLHTPALNEVTLTNGPIPHLLSFQLHCDSEVVENCYADGMILSTPTGSTAYSRSAGGPVIDPCMDCICATPICPQSMNNHPVIFRGESVLELCHMHIRCPDNRIYLSVDGRESFILAEQDTVRITHSPYRTRIIRVKKGGFLSALRRKLT